MSPYVPSPYTAEKRESAIFMGYFSAQHLRNHCNCLRIRRVELCTGLYVAALSIAKMLPSNFHQKLNFISKSKLVMKLHQVSSSELRIYGIKALTEDYHSSPSNLEKEPGNEVL